MELKKQKTKNNTKVKHLINKLSIDIYVFVCYQRMTGILCLFLTIVLFYSYYFLWTRENQIIVSLLWHFFFHIVRSIIILRIQLILFKHIPLRILYLKMYKENVSFLYIDLILVVHAVCDS